MKLFKLSSRGCAILFLCACLLFWAFLAWKIGEANAMETVWVAMERIVDAEANIPIQQVNILRGVAHGVPVFLVGAVISAMLTELYYAALESFRGKTAPQ